MLFLTMLDSCFGEPSLYRMGGSLVADSFDLNTPDRWQRAISWK
jgi:hypothetical protein